MDKVKLCCIFNYAPLYRRSIYKKIDQEFDAQFCFSDMESDIAKMEYADFKKTPMTIRDRHILGLPLVWRRDILTLPFQSYSHFLVIGDAPLSYFPFLLLCHILGKKVYAWGHGPKSFGGKMGWYVRWLMHHFDIYFTYGERGRQRLIDLGIPSGKLEVIYNSLNAGVNQEERQFCQSDKVRNHFGNELPTILFVGRLTKIKQLDWILKAQYQHKLKGLKYNLLLIGDGSEKKSLEKLACDLHLDANIWFYGSCYDEDELSSLLFNVNLCVSPGNVGLTALHAMSYGTPVLSNDDFETQMPEYETIQPGKTGDLYAKGNFQDFCDKIEKWLTARVNRDTVRKNCYAVINNKFNSEYQIKLLQAKIK